HPGKPGADTRAAARGRCEPRPGRRALAAVLQPVRGDRGRRRVGADRHRPQLLVPARPQTRAAQVRLGCRMMSLAEQMEEIAAALEPLTSEISGLQVYAFLNMNPTPPSIDVYPGDPFQTGAGYGVGQSQVFFTVRGRVSTADEEAGTRLLLRMLDPNDPASVEAALAEA